MKKMSQVLVAFCLICLLFCDASPAIASIIASSDFDGGNDGWTWSSSAISWQSSGGHPYGYIRYNNNIASEYTIYAPAEYLGNWESLGVTNLTYEANVFQTGSVAKTNHYSVTIYGPGGEYTWLGPTADASISWRLLDVAIVESDWTQVSGTWEALLTDVTELRIHMAYYTNYTPFEITGIDNVELNAVPLPASFWLLSAGIAGLAGLKRKFNR